MENEFTKKQKVLGLLTTPIGDYYVVGWKKLTDESGNGLEGIGWLVTSTIPLNQEMLTDEEVMPVYNPASLAIGGCVLFGLPELPQEIDVFNVEYVDDEDDELYDLIPQDTMDALTEPEKMSEDAWDELLTKLDKMKIEKGE